MRSGLGCKIVKGNASLRAISKKYNPPNDKEVPGLSRLH